jgi:hypothetical protein
MLLISLLTQVSHPALPTLRADATATPIPFPASFMKSVKDYGAKGDGVSDDTAAIQAALNDGRVDAGGNPLYSPPDQYNGRPKALFFPTGTYRVSKTLKWVGCCLTLQGQGPQASVIQLSDGAAGFGDPAAPRPVIQTESGNMSFRQNVWDLGVNTGRNNAGAMGVDWIASNVGALRNVRIVSGDGQGVAGLDMTRAWPGPSLAKHVVVQGFDYGIRVGTPEYGPTFEHITVQNQRVAGLLVDKNIVALRAFTSTNTVPALQNPVSYASVILLDAALNGGSPSRSAIENGGYLYARNVSTSGYASAISGTTGTTVTEYLSGKPQSLFDSSPSPKSLNLPVRETPAYHDDDLSQWAAFTPSEYGRTETLQATLNSGKRTVYFPFGVYFSYNERAVTVPAGVRRIVGFSSVVNSDANGANGGGIRFIVQEPSAEPLIIEGFGYGVKVDHRSARPVAIKNGFYQYFSNASAGDLYLEDVGIEPLVIQPSQHVWARQFNNEYGGTKVVNNGGTLWLMGMKTERGGTVVETKNGGRTEFLGTLLYPSRAIAQDEPAFISRDSQVALIYGQNVYCPNCGYAIQVEETRNGQTRQLKHSGGYRMPLYVGFASTPTPNLPPRVYLPMVHE